MRQRQTITFIMVAEQISDTKTTILPNNLQSIHFNSGRALGMLLGRPNCTCKDENWKAGAREGNQAHSWQLSTLDGSLATTTCMIVRERSCAVGGQLREGWREGRREGWRERCRGGC